MKKFFGLILVMLIALVTFAGCDDHERTVRDDSWATNTYDEAILYEDIITENIITEDIIFESFVN